MSFQFNNISSLSLSKQSRFLQAGFNYSNIKNISIQGYVTDLTNSFGVTGIWNGINSTQYNAIDYQPLIINGYNFGSGRVIGVTYDNGIDVRTKTYSAEIEILETGNLFNLTGEFYDNINLVAPEYLKEFSENWNFNKKENGGYSYNHQASITFSTGVGNTNQIDSAKTLAKSIFTGANLGFAFYSGFSNKQGKRFFSESYDLISKACSFSETFDFDSNNGPHSILRSHSTNLDQNGIISISERGDIRGIENPNYQKALSALNQEFNGSYIRCSGVVSNYFPSVGALINSPIEQNRSFDLFANTLSYEISYNNNPNNLTGYFWDYSQQISRINGIGTILENGTLIGKGANRTEAFQSVSNGYQNIKNSIESRMTGLFNVQFGSPNAFVESKNESHSPNRSQLSYEYKFSNDPSLISNSGIKYLDVKDSIGESVYLFNKFNILNQKQIAQDGKQSTVAQRDIRIAMQGDKTVSFNDFMSRALTEINSKIPVESNKYIQNVDYSYSPNENSLNANITWLYNKTALRTPYPQ